MRCKICESTFTSKISGRLSTTHGSSLKSAAGRMATAAFFAPLTVTVPFNGFPPFMINVGSKYNSSRFWRMLFPGPWSYGKRPQSISALRLCAHIINASSGFDNALPAPPCRKREKRYNNAQPKGGIGMPVLKFICPKCNHIYEELVRVGQTAHAPSAGKRMWSAITRENAVSVCLAAAPAIPPLPQRTRRIGNPFNPFSTVCFSLTGVAYSIIIN